MAGNWKEMLLKKNVPIFEKKPNVRKVIPVEIVDKNTNIVKVKSVENDEQKKVEYFGLKGKEIQKLRNEKKLTQKELATKLAIHVSDLQHIESGKAVFNNGLYKRILTLMKE